ncbi:hypothetical protein A2U01_0082126, partial [Trifolium medium]|nr:hypothetical protein [Trifolium medium]
MNRDTWRDPNDVDVMYILALVALLKELVWLVTGRGGGDDGGEVKGGDK